MLFRSGAVLALSSAIANERQVLSATTLDEAQMAFIPREKLGKLMQDHPAIGHELVRLLSEEVNDARRKLAMLRGA